MYDETMDQVEAAGNLVVLPEVSDDKAYAEANRAILDEAISLVRDALKHLGGGHLSPLAFQLIVMAIALPGTVVTGMLSYQYLESPFLRFKKRFTFVRSRPV